MQRSYRLMARLVRMVLELKGGARTGVRTAVAQTTQGAAGGAATVGRGIKGATSQGGAMKDFASGGRTWWSHMPKTPQLPGALADAAQSGCDQPSDAGDASSWMGGLNGSEDMSYLDGELADLDLMALRTDTPADVLLGILSDMIDGRQPDLRDVALARTVLLRHMDLYEPLNSGGHIRTANLDADVVDALMHQLGAANPTAESLSDPGPRIPSFSVRSTTAGDDDGAASSPLAGEDQEEGLSPDCLRDALAALVGLPSSPLQLQRPAAEGSEAEGSEAGGSDSEVSISGAALVPPPMLDEVERALALADSWQYDTWRLAEASQGHSLSCLGFYLLHREGLISQFRIRPTKLARLLRTLESGYPANPYHNSTHAADVLQTLHVLLRGAGLTTHYLDRLGLMAAYFAAIIHDHGHPGLTADFLIATSDSLAVRYNDRSPLENHHCASFFGLLQQPGMDALEGLGQAERAAFRKLVLDLVMSTDMKQHFSLLAHFNTAHHLPPYNKDAGPWALARSAVGRPRASRSGHEPIIGGAEVGMGGQQQPQYEGDEAAVVAAGGGCGCGVAGLASREEPRPLDETERLLSLQIALKAADLGHLGEELEVHMRWVRSLEEEFFCQGDREAQLGLPISPLFDRTKQGVSKSQVGFYDFIALPLVHALASAFPGAKPLLACFTDNYDHWRAVEKAAVDKAAADMVAAAAVPGSAEPAATSA